MDIISTLTLTASFIGIAAIAAVRLGREPKRPGLPPIECFGDFPHVCEEMRPARRNGGGGSPSKDGLAVTHTQVQSHTLTRQLLLSGRGPK